MSKRKLEQQQIDLTLLTGPQLEEIIKDARKELINRKRREERDLDEVLNEFQAKWFAKAKQIIDDDDNKKPVYLNEDEIITKALYASYFHMKDRWWFSETRGLDRKYVPCEAYNCWWYRKPGRMDKYTGGVYIAIISIGGDRLQCCERCFHDDHIFLEERRLGIIISAYKDKVGAYKEWVKSK